MDLAVNDRRAYRDFVATFGAQVARELWDGIGREAARNLWNNVNQAGTSLIQAVHRQYREVYDWAMENRDDQPRNPLARRALKRTREESPEPVQEETQVEEPMVVAGRSQTGGQAPASSAGANTAPCRRMLKHMLNSGPMTFKKNFFLRLASYKPVLYNAAAATSPPADNPYYDLLNGIYAFDFGALAWYLSPTDAEIIGLNAKSFSYKVTSASAKINLIGQNSPFVTNVDNQSAANPGMTTVIGTCIGLEDRCPTTLRKITIDNEDLTSARKIRLGSTIPDNNAGVADSLAFRLYGGKAVRGDYAETGPGHAPPNLSATSEERFYDICAGTLCKVESTAIGNYITTAYPDDTFEFKRGADVSGTLLNWNYSNDNCYITVQDRRDNNQTGAFTQPIGNDTAASGANNVTNTGRTLEVNPWDDTGAGFGRLYKMHMVNDNTYLTGTKEAGTYRLPPWAYIKVQTPYSIDNNTVSPLQIKLNVETSVTIEMERNANNNYAIFTGGDQHNEYIDKHMRYFKALTDIDGTATAAFCNLAGRGASGQFD